VDWRETMVVDMIVKTDPPSGGGIPFLAKRECLCFSSIRQELPHWFMSKICDLDLCRNETKYKNNHEYKDAAEITLHFINIKELKFIYR
jgi:hypothetical protein